MPVASRDSKQPAPPRAYGLLPRRDFKQVCHFLCGPEQPPRNRGQCGGLQSIAKSLTNHLAVQKRLSLSRCDHNHILLFHLCVHHTRVPDEAQTCHCHRCSETGRVVADISAQWDIHELSQSSPLNGSGCCCVVSSCSKHCHPESPDMPVRQVPGALRP